jgi:hypothetical protein
LTPREAGDLTTALVNFSLVRMQAVSLLLIQMCREHIDVQAMADDNPDFALTFVEKALGETLRHALDR